MGCGGRTPERRSKRVHTSRARRDVYRHTRVSRAFLTSHAATVPSGTRATPSRALVAVARLVVDDGRRRRGASGGPRPARSPPRSNRRPDARVRGVRRARGEGARATPRGARDALARRERRRARAARVAMRARRPARRGPARRATPPRRRTLRTLRTLRVLPRRRPDDPLGGSGSLDARRPRPHSVLPRQRLPAHAAELPVRPDVLAVRHDRVPRVRRRKRPRADRVEDPAV